MPTQAKLLRWLNLDLNLNTNSSQWFSTHARAPFIIKNQESCVFETYSIYKLGFFSRKIKKYTYNFNDKNTTNNMYTYKKLHSYIVINISI